ncbi:MAG: acetoacetate decarboxylase family protein [Clostridia bacterium]|nr:acetoacetate decarboxylase family protein [Clostridia bacterium]
MSRKNFFVADEAALKNYQDHLKDISFIQCNLYAQFETTEEFLREVLPPCFEMPDKPLVDVYIGKWLWDIPGCDHFDIASILLSCKYKGVEGSYQLELYLEDGMAVALGREVWGEGKKVGITQMFHYGKDIYAYCERNGQRIIEIEAELGEDMGPVDNEGYGFELKAQPHGQGYGFQHDPQVVMFHAKLHNRVYKEGTGVIRFNSSKYDRLDTIPVVKMVKTYYLEGKKYGEVLSVDDLTDGAEKYMPTYFAQKYDLPDDYFVVSFYDNDKE